MVYSKRRFRGNRTPRDLYTADFEESAYSGGAKTGSLASASSGWLHSRLGHRTAYALRLTDAAPSPSATSVLLVEDVRYGQMWKSTENSRRLVRPVFLHTYSRGF